MMNEPGTAPASRRRITLERTYAASVEDAWEPWTTKEGIESWWGVELHPTAQGVRMLLTFDGMHDEVWTQRAVMGWGSELGKLAKVLEG